MNTDRQTNKQTCPYTHKRDDTEERRKYVTSKVTWKEVGKQTSGGRVRQNHDRSKRNRQGSQSSFYARRMVVLSFVLEMIKKTAPATAAAVIDHPSRIENKAIPDQE